VSEGAAFEIRPVEQQRLVELLQLRWPERTMLVAGRFVQPEDVEGIGAFTGDRLHGIATWLVSGRMMHIVAVNSFSELRGIGVALVDAMIEQGKVSGMATLRASISNDNVVALRFYQKRGFRLTALHRGIYDAMRQVRPSIPLAGLDNIPIRDELELDYDL
jgi:GNAT superfamily N-acetyltransferase